MAQNIATGLSVAPASEETLLAGPVAGRAPAFVVSFEDPIASSVAIYTHPIAPPPAGQFVGTYYPFASQIPIATAGVLAGGQAVLIPGTDRTFRQVGLTIRNDGPATIVAQVDAFAEPDGAEG